MHTSRIIRLTILPDCTRQETYTFAVPISLRNTQGEIEELLTGEQKDSLRYSLIRLEPIISSAGILKVREPLQIGDVVLIPVPKKKMLAEIVIHSSATLDLLLDREGLLYQFAVGKDGIFEVTAKLVKDEEGFYTKLKANLDDVAMREYLVKSSLADSQVTQAHVDKVPERMTHAEAANYLRMPKSTLYDKVGGGKIRRVKSGKRNLYLKEDLDAYLRRRKNK